MHRPDAMAGSARARHARRPRGAAGRAGSRDRCGTRPRRRRPVAAHASAAAANPIARARRLMRRGQALLGPRGRRRQARVSATLSRPSPQAAARGSPPRRRPAGERRKRPPCAAAIEATTRRPWPRRGSRTRASPRSDAPDAVFETEMRTPPRTDRRLHPDSEAPVLDRVGDQVVERLRHPARVRHRHRRPGPPAQLERAAGLRGSDRASARQPARPGPGRPPAEGRGGAQSR